MKVDCRKTIKGNLVCCFLMEGQKPPKGLVQVHSGFSGELGDAYPTGAKGMNVLLVGLGRDKDFREDYLRRASGAAARFAAKIKEGEFSIIYPGIDTGSAQAITEGAILSSYRFERHRSKKDFKVKAAHIISGRDVSAGIKIGTITAGAQNYSRELDEEPANIATPLSIAKEARRLAKEKGLAVTVFDKKALERKGMRGILAVARGSAQPPVLVKLEYNKGKRLPLYCIVGKGVTFDTGGISLKPPKNMHEMKYDKTGAINVLGVMKAVAELRLPIRVMGLLPLTENTPGGNAQKPGDIFKAYNGKTVEVLNTDAEGRLILADTLSYAAEQKPECIIDIATLTGAMVISLGRHAIGMFTDDEKLARALEQAGVETHERVWRLPLWSEYGEMLKSEIADLQNLGEHPEAGSITAAAFLKEFTGGRRWAHLDIASVDRINYSHGYLGNGASGIGVRLVTRALEKLSNKKR